MSSLLSEKRLISEEEVEEHKDNSVNESKEKKQEKEQLKKKVKSENHFEVDLGGTRRVSVAEYKGSILVNIREYYKDRDTGAFKPGSKGIALTVDQWHQLIKQAEVIDEAISSLKD